MKVAPFAVAWILLAIVFVRVSREKDAEIARLKSVHAKEVTKLVNPDEVVKLTQSVTTLEERIKTLQTQFTEYKDSVHIRVDNYEDKIKTLENDLHFREDQVIRLRQTVTTLRSQNNNLMTENAVLKNRTKQ